MKSLAGRALRDLATANRFSRPRIRPITTARFALAPASPDDFHLARPRSCALDPVFRLQEARTVSNDWVVRYPNRCFQLTAKAGRRRRGARSTSAKRAMARLDIRYRDRPMPWTEIAAPPPRAPPRWRPPRQPPVPRRRSARRRPIIPGASATPTWAVIDPCGKPDR